MVGGDVIDLPSMRLSSFTLRAEGSPLTLDEVLFELKGPISETYRDLSPTSGFLRKRASFLLESLLNRVNISSFLLPPGMEWLAFLS